ncbi:50S ribosomal protein L4 [Flavobacteriales bacterium]|jgi:large subunit ribosomal protein L4|nr:50S ribosomal protein L4 [Flavobacteriales bacterium]MDA9775586.1 50S ribosomal protein L4 [Flavobacteriales bacterium]MDB4052072.1 50S ribosomal protein L4 [Flavobacteriales bacterium]MDC1352943.1 50S ribosomal protein L4 [Flavobacteriales bacterium]|tara:strand:+ start:1188 stop:1814 length:627 start_codon:yes stop_codon:yes gene_type:complete
MSIEIQNIEGKSSGKKVTLNNDIFAVEPNDHAIYLDVKWYLARRRQGTSKAKERAEVTGSTRKIKKQKGTGTARAGSIKSPLFKGGGTVFGPAPRDYDFKMNRKLKKVARRSALTYKAQKEDIIVLEDFVMKDAKTKDFKIILEKLGIDSEKSLFLLPEKSDNLYLASRNIPNAMVVTADSINSYEVMNANKLVVVESALKTIDTYLA